MEEILNLGQDLRLNPYVTQTQRLSKSLQNMAQTFARIETDGQAQVTEYMEGIELFSQEIHTQMCKGCNGAMECNTKHAEKLQELIGALVEDIDEYGLELSVKNKREFSKQCLQFEELKSRVERNLWEIKSNHVWEERLVQSQHASFVIIESLLKALEETTKEIDASVFRDERLEKRIRKQLKRMGVRTLKVMMFLSEKGIYEIHVSAKAKGEGCVTTQDMAYVISRSLGRRLEPEYKEGFVLKEGYHTVTFVERPKYQTLCGVAKKVKEGSECSGDNFLLMDCSGGKKCVLISDGMGSGKLADSQSQKVLELSEILLESGVPPIHAVEMMNALLVSEVGEVKFATLDMGLVDTYEGTIELLKAGASTTYVVSNHMLKGYEASSLPVGVLVDSKVNRFCLKGEGECYIVMLTDGVLEGIPQEEREVFIRKIMKERQTKNPTEIAEKILEEASGYQEGGVKDDMMVLVLGVWELK